MDASLDVLQIKLDSGDLFSHFAIEMNGGDFPLATFMNCIVLTVAYAPTLKIPAYGFGWVRETIYKSLVYLV